MRRSELLFEVDNRPKPAFARFMKDIGIPGETLSAIDDQLQRRFFQKGPDGLPLERWDLNEIDDFHPEIKIKEHLTRCGFCNATRPSKKVYTRAAWPGALMLRALVRLADLVQAWENGTRFEEVVVFGGQRELLPEKEYPLLAMRQETGLRFSLTDEERTEGFTAWKRQGIRTELDMMRWLWERMELPPVDSFHSIPAVFVDAPMKPPLKEGDTPIRPNTEDTILHWVQEHQPRPGSMLVSSGAPYGMAQDVAFWNLLGPSEHTVETFGHEAPDLPIQVFMQEVAGCVHRIRNGRAA